MHENRTTYPKKKTQMYQLLQDLPKKYSVTALVRMEKVRASQLLPLRKKLQGEVEILVEKPLGWEDHIIPKGYVALNGVSLTVGKVTDDNFSVFLIPETI